MEIGSITVTGVTDTRWKPLDVDRHQPISDAFFLVLGPQEVSRYF